MVFQAAEFGHHLFENAVFGGFDGNQAARRFDAVGGVGDLRAGFGGHERGKGGVAQAVFDDVGAQAFPIEMQRLGADGVEVFFVGVDRQFALRINGLAKQRAGAVFFGQFHRGFEQVVLHGFKGAVGQGVGRTVAVFHAVFSQIVAVVDHADAQRAAPHGGGAGGFDRVVLIIQQGIERAYGQVGQAFEFVEAFQRAKVEGRQGAQGDFAVFVVDVVQRFGWQSDFHAQIGLVDGGDARVKRAVGVAVVDVLNVDAAGAGALLHQDGEEFGGRQAAFADAFVLLVLLVQALEFVLVGEKGFIEAGHFVGREQGDVFAFNQAGVEQAVDLHAVIELADAVVFHAAVVFQHQQAFHFQMPQRVKQRGRTAAHAALRAGLDGSLKHFEEGDAAGVLRFAAADFAAQRADAAAVDADAGALRNVFDNRAGGGVDGIQAVVALDQYAGAELAGGRAHAAHNRRRQRDFEGGNRVVKAFHIIQAGVFRVFGKQAHRHQNVEKLRCFKDLAGYTVLHQILAFQLFDGGVGEG